MKKCIILLVYTLLCSLQLAKAQYSPITLIQATSYYSSYNSQGSTSYNFYYRIGKNGDETEIKDGSNLRQYLKVCPDAIVSLDKYLKYRNICKRNKVGLILSAVVLLPGVILLANGIAKPSIPLTAVGATCIAGGIFGIPFCKARGKKAVYKAVDYLPEAVSLYNKYIIDNNLSTKEE